MLDLNIKGWARDEYFMSHAIEEAKLSALRGEVPVGAVIVRENIIIAKSGNRREELRLATAHAEHDAIMAACKYLNGWRLMGCELYITLEPCIMCAGAIINARLPRVIIGTTDPKSGAFGSITDVNLLLVNHHPEMTLGVLESECAALLSDFFKERRGGGGVDVSADWRRRDMAND